MTEDIGIALMRRCRLAVDAVLLCMALGLH